MLQRLYLIGALAALAATVMVSAKDATADASRSMPPAVVEGDKNAVVERFVGAGEIAHRVTAGAWSAPVMDAAKASASASGERSKPFQIGYPRAIAAELRTLPLTTLSWQALADGSQVVRVEIQASDAVAFRVGYRVTGPLSGLQLRVSGIGRDEVYAATPIANELSWSPVLEGDTGIFELRVMPGFSPEQFQVTLDQLSHLVVSPASLGQKEVSRIGKSGSCNIDVACVSTPSAALLNAAKSVAKMVFTDSSGTYSCTGTLLNSTSGANYFYTAAHCISSQAAAATLSTYWFFDAVSCNSLAIPPYQLVNGGSDLLVTDLTLDVTLLQLRVAPPTGAIRSAWNAKVIPTTTNLIGLHHPSGDLKKFSQGNMQGYGQGPASYNGIARPQFSKDSFIKVQWAQGTTEKGSSGSGVFTFNPNCSVSSRTEPDSTFNAGCYELRGGLEGGAASCTEPTGVDRFSRMDLMYTKLAPYLQPSEVIPVSTPTQSSMVEFFNPQFDFYFISSRENEKTFLDSFTDNNANRIWFRTGYWFKTDPTPSSITSSITRYYIPGAAKGGSRGSHFYTAVNSDKSAISGTGKERFAPCDTVPNGFFCNEGTDSYIAQPIKTGNTVDCLSTEQKIYRVFRGAPRYVDDGNHRYVTNADIYNYMVGDLGWTGESINFCAKP